MSKKSVDEESITFTKSFLASHGTDASSLYQNCGPLDGYVTFRKPIEEKAAEENNNISKDDSVETTGVPSSFETNVDSQ